MRVGLISVPPLFSTHDLHAVLEGQRERLLAAIEAHPAADIRSRSLDDLVAYFVNEFKIQAPELTEGAVSAEVEEGEVDVSGDPQRFVRDRSRPFHVPGIVATYYVPFKGDRALFECQPSTFTTSYPWAEVTDHELQFRVERADTNVAATKQAFEAELAQVRQYLEWVARDVAQFNAELPGHARSRLDRRQKRLREMDAGTEALGIPVRRATPVEPPRTTVAPAGDAERHYDVALSFAGEDRDYVKEVAKLLTAAGVSVFYDQFEKALLWGKNLIDHLADIYQNRSRYVVMFISEHYVRKAWPKHERTHAQARALIAKEEYILPARFDDTEVPGLAGSVGYVDLRGLAPCEFVELLLVKLGRATADRA